MTEEEQEKLVKKLAQLEDRLVSASKREASMRVASNRWMRRAMELEVEARELRRSLGLARRVR